MKLLQAKGYEQSALRILTLYAMGVLVVLWLSPMYRLQGPSLILVKLRKLPEGVFYAGTGHSV